MAGSLIGFVDAVSVSPNRRCAPGGHRTNGDKRWMWTLVARTAMPASIDAAAAVPGGYRSAMEGYQPYSETKMVPWKEANDTVGKIGGWRAYAKEVAEKGPGQQGHAGHHPADAPKPAAGPAKP